MLYLIFRLPKTSLLFRDAVAKPSRLLHGGFICQCFFIYPWFLPGVLLSLKATKRGKRSNFWNFPGRDTGRLSHSAGQHQSGIGSHSTKKPRELIKTAGYPSKISGIHCKTSRMQLQSFLLYRYGGPYFFGALYYGRFHRRCCYRQRKRKFGGLSFVVWLLW